MKQLVVFIVGFLALSAMVGASHAGGTFISEQFNPYVNFFYWFGYSNTNIQFGSWSNCPDAWPSGNYPAITNSECLAPTANGNNAIANSGWDYNTHLNYPNIIYVDSSNTAIIKKPVNFTGATVIGQDNITFISKNGVYVASPTMNNTLEVLDNGNTKYVVIAGNLIFSSGSPSNSTFENGQLYEYAYVSSSTYNNHAGLYTNAINVPSENAYLVLAGIWNLTSYQQTPNDIANAIDNTAYISDAPVSASTLSVTGFSASNSTLDPGQYEIFNTVISGGIGPFTVNLINQSKNDAVVQSVTANSDGTISFKPILAGAPGNYIYFASVTDNGAIIPYSSNSPTNSIEVYSQPSVTFSLSPKSTYFGSNEVYTVYVAGGNGPFTVNLMLSGNVIPIQTNSMPSDGTNQFQFTANALGNNKYYVSVTDNGVSTPYTFNSAQASLLVAKTPTATDFTASNSSIDQQQYEVFKVTIKNGIGPFTVNLINYTNSNTVMQTVNIVSPSTATFNAFQANDIGAFTYFVSATDKGANTPYVFNSPTNTINVYTPLTVPPTQPSVTNSTLDQNQSAFITSKIIVPSNGAVPYKYTWMYSSDGGSSFAPANAQCVDGTATNSVSANKIVTCDFATSTSTPLGSYLFKLYVQDSATTPENAMSPTTQTILLNPPLIPANTPTTINGTIDQTQVATIKDTIPGVPGGSSPYFYQWLVEAPGQSSFTPSLASECSNVPPGVNISISALGSNVVCVFPTNTSTKFGTYSYELQLKDGASTPNVMVSKPTSVVLNRMPTAVIVPSNVLADNGQLETYNVIINYGQGSYNALLLNETLGNVVTPTTTANPVNIIGTHSGSGLITLPATYKGTSPNGFTPSYEVKATDIGTNTPFVFYSPVNTIAVNTTLIPSSPASTQNARLDENQIATVTSELPDTGTYPYSYQWFVAFEPGTYNSMHTVPLPSNSIWNVATPSQCAVPTGASQPINTIETCTFNSNNNLPFGTYFLKLQTTDGATTPQVQNSTATWIELNSTLTKANTPTTQNGVIDLTQVANVVGYMPTTGTYLYNYEWYVSLDNGPYYPAGSYPAYQAANSVVCINSSGASGVQPGTQVDCLFYTTAGTTLGNYSFELKVTDGANTPETTYSAPTKVKVDLPPIPVINSNVSISGVKVDTLTNATVQADSEVRVDQGQVVTLNSTLQPLILPAGTSPNVNTTGPYGGSFTYNTVWEVAFNALNGTSSTGLTWYPAKLGVCSTHSNPSQYSNSSQVAGNVVSCLFNTANVITTPYGFGTYFFQLQETDSANTPVTNTSMATIPIRVYPHPFTTLSSNTLYSSTPSNSFMYGNDILTQDFAFNGVSPFLYGWTLNNANANNVTINDPLINRQSTNTIMLPGVGSYNFNVVSIDIGTTVPFTLGLESNPISVFKNNTFGANTVTASYCDLLPSGTTKCFGVGQGGSYTAGYYDIMTLTFNGLRTINNQSQWSLYVNHAFYGSTNSVITWTGSSTGTPGPGAYNFTFTNGNSNYTTYSLNTTLLLSQLGTSTNQTSGSPSPPQINTGGGSPGPAVPGGNFKPVVLNVSNSTGTGYVVLNFTQHNTVSVVVGGKRFNITENFITPTTAGITINGRYSYDLSVGQVINVTADPSYLELLNISYIPIVQTIKLFIYSQPSSTPPATTTVPATSTVPTTTVPFTTIPTTTVSSNASTTSLAKKGVIHVPPIVPIGVTVVAAVIIGYVVSRSVTTRRKRA
jgi:hypothetical protein